MAKHTSIALGAHFEDFIASQIQSGRYGSASEVIRSALRLLENQETKWQSLRNFCSKVNKAVTPIMILSTLSTSLIVKTRDEAV